MSEELSPRARAILDTAERAVAARAAAGTGIPAAAADLDAGAARAHQLAAAPTPLPTAPRADWSSPTPSPLPTTPPGQLLAVVDQVVQAAEAARRRLDELSATIEELTRRVDAAGRPAGAPIDAAAPPQPGPPPAAPPQPGPTWGKDGESAPLTEADSPSLSATPFGARPRPPAGTSRPTGRAGEASAATSSAGADPAAAKLLAVEMAVAGATRMEADRRLRDELGLRETRVLLDEVYGVDSPPGARMPWGDAAPAKPPPA